MLERYRFELKRELKGLESSWELPEPNVANGGHSGDWHWLGAGLALARL
jgi:hypothetical protein